MTTKVEVPCAGPNCPTGIAMIPEKDVLAEEEYIRAENKTARQKAKGVTLVSRPWFCNTGCFLDYRAAGS